MPSNIHPISSNTKILGVYVTPKANRLIPLFLVLFTLIFTASKGVGRTFESCWADQKLQLVPLFAAYLLLRYLFLSIIAYYE